MPPELDAESQNEDNNASQTDVDRIFLQRAFAIACDTDDPLFRDRPEVAVGAVITRNRLVVAESANRIPPRLREFAGYKKENIDSDNRYLVIEHAERAAIYTAFAAGKELAGATMYCTRFPCSDCARTIVWAGISRLVVARGIQEETRWLKSQRVSRQMIRDAGVILRYLTDDTLKTPCGD